MPRWFPRYIQDQNPCLSSLPVSDKCKLPNNSLILGTYTHWLDPSFRPALTCTPTCNPDEITTPHEAVRYHVSSVPPTWRLELLVSQCIGPYLPQRSLCSLCQPVILSMKEYLDPDLNRRMLCTCIRHKLLHLDASSSGGIPISLCFWQIPRTKVMTARRWFNLIEFEKDVRV